MTTFGRTLLAEWPLDPDVTYLNHGTVGVVPRRVLAAQTALRDEMERQPSVSLLRDLVRTPGMTSVRAPRMRAAAAEIAARLGSRPENLVFVDNTTAGCNAIFRSLEWRAGDEILVNDHTYGAITLAAKGITRDRGVIVRGVVLPDASRGVEAILDAIVSAIGPRTKIVVVDHVTAPSALVLPVGTLVARCRTKGAAVLVDGAHAPGALPLDLEAIGADWYVGNLHKWAQAPRSCAILWASPARQATMHPPVLSWFLDQGFTAEFDMVGTRDYSPFLAAPEGWRFMDSLGLDAMRAHNHALVWRGTRMVAERWGGRFEVDEALVGCMAALELPLSLGTTADDAMRLRDALWFEDRIEVGVHPIRDHIWMRVAAQAYNDDADFERLADAVTQRIPAAGRVRA